MSRNSRRIRRQRQRQRQRKRGVESPAPRHGSRVNRLLSTYSIESVCSLLEAASISPGSSHRGSAIAYLFDGAMKQQHWGAAAAHHDALPELIRATDRTQRHLAQSDDFQPYDGRNEVVVRWGNNAFRMLAGSLERPTVIVREQALLASVIDDTLLPVLGFGLGDAGELVLRRIDSAARSVLQESPPGPQPKPGDPAAVTEPEVRAAAHLKSFASIASDCSDPARAVRALAYFTVQPSDLTFNPSMGTLSRFGTALGVLSGGQEWAVPVGFLPETLPAIASELATLAAEHDSSLHATFASRVASHISNRLLATGHPTMGPMIARPKGDICLIVKFNESRILFLNLIAALTDDRVQELLDSGAELLSKVHPGMSLATSEGVIVVPKTSDIVRLQVIVRPQSVAPMLVAGPFITMGDLEWIIYQSLQSVDDLWFFARDLERPQNATTMFAWDTIDKWEVWKQQKGFYRGGKPISGIVFAPHAALSEWEDAARSCSVEKALYVLGLPALADWPLVDVSDDGSADVADPRDRALHIMTSPIPMAIARVDPSARDQSDETLWRLATAIAWKLKHSGEALASVAHESDIESLRIDFEYQERSEGPILTVEAASGGRLRIGFDSRLQSALAGGSLEVEALCGRVVAAAFSSDVKEQLLSAWDAAPPGIRVDGVLIREQARNLPNPVRGHEAIHYAVLRQLSEFLATENIATGIRTDNDAIEFESGTVFPWLVARFHESISNLSMIELIRFGTRQLEMASRQRLMLEKRLGWELGFPVRGESDTLIDRDEISLLIRSISFAIEEMVAHPPQGDQQVAEADWMDALSIGDLCIESCFRSDSIHQRLTNTSIEITELYEIRTGDSGDQLDVDLDAYRSRRAASDMPEAVPISSGLESAPPTNQARVGLLEAKPELQPINQAMLKHMGFGIEHAVGILNAAIEWEVTDLEPVAITDKESIIERCMLLMSPEDRTEIENALNWLILSSAGLSTDVIPHWETERREKRIATNPFLSLEEDIYVMPWTAESTLRIFAGYVEDGRLPWPNRVLPGAVITSLNHFRQARNREVEKDCVEALSAASFVVVGGLKPQKAHRYGIEKLSGEIDALCLDPRRSRFWVIEAKDPYIPYSAYQVRRLINDFEEPGKYVDKLLQKVDDISNNKDAVAQALGVRTATTEWTVDGLMVTRRVEPAAFVSNPRVRYCVLNDLVSLLSRDHLPPFGFFDADGDY